MTTPTTPRVRSVLALTLCALAPACLTSSGKLGELDDTGDDVAMDDGGSEDGVGGSATSTGGGDDGMGESDDGDDPSPACVESMGASSGRALDGVKWHNTVADLLGVDSTVNVDAPRWPVYPAPVPSAGFETIYAQGAAAVANATDVATLLSCAPQAVAPEADACIEAFAGTLGRLAWRRALETDELAALAALDPAGTAETRARLVIEALLSSPSFWTIDQTGAPDPDDPTLWILDDHAIAARLAYFIWNSTPDDELLARAEAGELTDPAVRAEEVDRMLADPRAARAIGDFWEAVLDTRTLQEGEHDTELFPQMDAQLVAAMRAEVRALAADVVLDEGTWSALLHTTRSFVNAPLAAGVYGSEVLGAAPSGDALEEVELDPARRPGLLTRAAAMARWTHPAFLGTSSRGLFVRERLLCDQIPPPPPEVDVDISPDTPGDRYELLATHAADAACSGCHTLFDPITPGFDNYDPIGQWQTEITVLGGPPQSGVDAVPVMPSGDVVGLEGGGQFADRDGLIELLTTAPEAMGCHVQHQLEYAFGRALVDADTCTLEGLQDAFVQSGGDLRQLVHAIVAGDAFVRVRPL